jgi:hypothetical protein
MTEWPRTYSVSTVKPAVSSLSSCNRSTRCACRLRKLPSQLARRNVCTYELQTYQHMLNVVITVPWCAAEVPCSTEKRINTMRHRRLQFVCTIFSHTWLIFTDVCLIGILYRFPAWDSSLLHRAQIGSGSTPASYPMRTGSCSGGETDHYSSAEVKNTRSYSAAPPYVLMAWYIDN